MPKTELVWDGKYLDEARTKRVTPFKTPLPFQTVETVNESAPERRNLLSFLDRDKPWRNRLVWGDKKYVLPSLLPEFAGKVNHVYIDPPFDTGADFSFNATIHDGPDEDDEDGGTFPKQPSIIEQKAYRDTWGKGIDSYLQWFYETATILHELLADNGSIYVHLDWRLIHYARSIMDEVFGIDFFINELIWLSGVGDTSAKNRKFIKSHDSILMYSGSGKRTWNDVFQEYSDASDKLYKYEDGRGKYRIGPIDNPGGGLSVRPGVR